MLEFEVAFVFHSTAYRESKGSECYSTFSAYFVFETLLLKFSDDLGYFGYLTSYTTGCSEF